VATAQAVAMTASAGSMFASFTLRLNAAILALSMNATSVAFADVVVETSATQPVTLTSGVACPRTINRATSTSNGFTISAAAFSITLNPSQATTSNIGADPTAMRQAAGQLTISSNASANGTAFIGLSDTGTATSGVSVAVAPINASTVPGAPQKFVASVTGTSNTAVTWKVSGAGCNGATCGTISSTRLYTAPATVPSTALLTITATSMLDLSKSASASVTLVPPQAAGYSLGWENTFSRLSVCTTNVAGCNWYNPRRWLYSAVGPGPITDPHGTYANLHWTIDTICGRNVTVIGTASMNGADYHAWTYGYFEVSMAFDPVTGSWPAIWMLVVSPFTPRLSLIKVRGN
jgi:hypothetical protein